MQIAQRKIGQDAPPFIIAKMSGNHNQSLERALEIVDAVAKSGAHALKIQTSRLAPFVAGVCTYGGLMFTRMPRII